MSAAAAAQPYGRLSAKLTLLRCTSPWRNICKFTKEGEIALRVRKVADGRDWVELAVADTGIRAMKAWYHPSIA